MIIGINGKLGSGKDTVGKIVQYLLCKNVGDISIEEIISCNDHDWWLDEQSKFEIKKFAGKLKQIGSILSGVPVEKFEDQEFKKLNMGSDWDHELVGEDWVDLKPVLVPMTYREFLQRLGTEAMRDGLHTNVWVNALFADYKDVYIGSWGQGNHMYEKPKWIITDMRFPNEMEAVVEKGGLTIRVVRPKPREMFLMNATTIIDTRIPEHPSETALDDARFDYEIINDGTIKELAEKVQIILIKEGLL